MKIKSAGQPVYLTFEERSCAPGASKFFGAPDLPETFEDPELKAAEDKYTGDDNIYGE